MMSLTTLPDVFVRQVLSMLTGKDRDSLIAAYPEISHLDLSVPRDWLDAISRVDVIVKSQARLELFRIPGPYTDATLQRLVCRWCGRVFRKLFGNMGHATDDHPEDFQRIGQTLETNRL